MVAGELFRASGVAAGDIMRGIVSYRRVATVLAGVLLSMSASCVSTHDRLIRQGYSEGYASGYDDGERSGYAAAGNSLYGLAKDANRFDSDSQYRQGWNDGFQIGKGQMEHMEAVTR